MRIFVHTGLLMQAETPNEVIGVLAHETGHITGGHLARAQEEIENRTIDTFESINPDEDWQPEEAKLVRPSATWTYLVHDSPFGSEMERLVGVVGKGLRKRR